MYDVLVYTGEVIDTIEEYGELYNILKFKQDNCFTEKVQERYLLENHFNALNDEVIPHKIGWFNFDKPLKFKVEKSDILYISEMSSNKWTEHVRAYAKQHGLSYMCAATDPNCSKSYKEGEHPLQKLKQLQHLYLQKHHQQEQEQFPQ